MNKSHAYLELLQSIESKHIFSRIEDEGDRPEEIVYIFSPSGVIAL